MKPLLENPCQSLRENLAEASRQSGRSTASMVAEIAWLRLFGIRAYDYFWFQLYLPLESGRKRDFLGNTGEQRLGRTLNRKADWGLTDDKLTCQSLLRSIDVPCAPVYATYHPGGRATDQCPVLTNTDELKQFLDDAPYPMFCKPTSEGGGRGCFRAEGWDGEKLRDHQGQEHSLDELVELLHRPSRFGSPGYLFCEPIEPHRALKDLASVPCTIRMVVLLADKPRVLGAFMRIPRPGLVADNLGATHANPVARVDVVQGTVSVGMVGLCARQKRYTHHPDNGAPIEGRRLPFWQECVEVVERGAALFPNLGVQGWDIAIAESGPIVVEVNARSDLRTMQAPVREPLLTPEVRSWLEVAAGRS